METTIFSIRRKHILTPSSCFPVGFSAYTKLPNRPQTRWQHSNMHSTYPVLRLGSYPSFNLLLPPARPQASQPSYISTSPQMFNTLEGRKKNQTKNADGNPNCAWAVALCNCARNLIKEGTISNSYTINVGFLLNIK